MDITLDEQIADQIAKVKLIETMVLKYQMANDIKALNMQTAILATLEKVKSEGWVSEIAKLVELVKFNEAALEDLTKEENWQTYDLVALRKSNQDCINFYKDVPSRPKDDSRN